MTVISLRTGPRFSATTVERVSHHTCDYDYRIQLMIPQWDTPTAAALSHLRTLEMMIMLTTRPLALLLTALLTRAPISLATMPSLLRPRMTAGRKPHNSTRTGTWRLSSKQPQHILSFVPFLPHHARLPVVDLFGLPHGNPRW